MPNKRVVVTPAPAAGRAGKERSMTAISQQSSEPDEADESSSDEEENGCYTYEKIRCGNDSCRIQRRWRWLFIVAGVFTVAAVFFAVIIVIMLNATDATWTQ